MDAKEPVSGSSLSHTQINSPAAVVQTSNRTLNTAPPNSPGAPVLVNANNGTIDWLEVFTELKKQITDFHRSQFERTKRPENDVLPIEIETIKKIKEIIDDVENLMRNPSSLTDATFSIITKKLKDIQPPQKTPGYRLFGGGDYILLHAAMHTLIKNLEYIPHRNIELSANRIAKLHAEKLAEAAIARLRNVEEESKTVSQIMQQSAQQMQEILAQAKVASEEAKKAREQAEEANRRAEQARGEGREEGMAYVLDKLVAFATRQGLKDDGIKLLKAIGRGEASDAPLLITMGPSHEHAISAVSNSDFKIKSQEDEMDKAKKAVGEAKFDLIKELIDRLGSKDKVSGAEERLAKLIIFQLMIHKNDMTVMEVLKHINSQIILAKLGLNPETAAKKFPNIYTILSNIKSKNEVLSKSNLTLTDYTYFIQLVSPQNGMGGGFYFPQDASATNYFSTIAAKLQGKKYAPDTSEEDYTKNFVSKVGSQASMHNGATPGNHTPAAASSVGAAMVSPYSNGTNNLTQGMK